MRLGAAELPANSACVRLPWMEYARCILCQNRVPAVSRGTGILTDYSPPVTFDASRSSSHVTVDRGNNRTMVER